MKYIESKVVHSGERNAKRQHRSVTIPIEQTAAYYFESTQQIKDFYNGTLEGIKYGRYGCPTQHAVEEKMAEVEHADRALLFPSGMSAITTSVLALVKQGDHILYTEDCYRNTRKFFSELLPQLSIETSGIRIRNIQYVSKFLKKNTRLIFAEVPSNPFLRVIDIALLSEFSRKNKLITLIDSSFASPINIKPIEYGADVVLHSATKYLGGHHDLCAGVVAGRKKIIERIQKYRDIFGGIINPHTSYLLLRGLQTLSLRMKEHNKSGLEIANYLSRHPKVKTVWYPGLTTHPDFEIAKNSMHGFGGVVMFSIKASETQTSEFVDALKIPYIATNFGGPQSLIEQHAVLTFFNNRKEADTYGIKGNLLRYSCGFENVQDVIADFENAFKQI